MPTPWLGTCRTPGLASLTIPAAGPPRDDLRAYATHPGPWRKFVSPRCPAGDMCVASQRGAWRMTLHSPRGAKATSAPSGGDGFASCSDAGPARGPSARVADTGADAARLRATRHKPATCVMSRERGLRDGATAAVGRSCCPILGVLLPADVPRPAAQVGNKCSCTVSVVVTVPAA